ncbi:MAG: hypothetical protein QG641_294 [Candidatus Poribacteria bacterium]|nr:hypothetical protein [Euryarchaeota archaeon]MDQ1327014.1 hypothetical protein [Candidatus Poribacteria bacterium]
MKDTEIKKLFKIPNSTLYDWKKRNDYRKYIINLLKKMTFDEVTDILKRTADKESEESEVKD